MTGFTLDYLLAYRPEHLSFDEFNTLVVDIRNFAYINELVDYVLELSLTVPELQVTDGTEYFTMFAPSDDGEYEGIPQVRDYYNIERNTVLWQTYANIKNELYERETAWAITNGYEVDRADSLLVGGNPTTVPNWAR